MTIFIGADHRGFNLKARIQNQELRIQGATLEIVDLGAKKLIPGDDYTEYAAAVARAVAKNPEQDRGIVICGSGVGVDIITNRFQKVRCALGFSRGQVQAARSDDNVNVLALAANFLDEEEAMDIVEAFLSTDFGNEERHRRRIRQIDAIVETQP